VGTALSRIFEVNASISELATIMGRAKRTGVGTAVFAKGGFVVDGGKPAKNGVCASEKFPPLIFRQDFPQNWRFIVAIPNVPKGLTSQEEASAFAKLPPMDVADVGKICRLTMLRLLPSLAEREIESFGDALTKIQVLTGKQFASAQGGIYSSAASAECIEYMQRIGVNGVGQSSWGPALYGVVRNEEAKPTLIKVQAHLIKSVGGQAFIAKANNKGATIRVLK
jgi:beta-RFAP synthase